MKHVYFVIATLFICVFNTYGQNTLSHNGISYQILPNQKDVAVIMPQDESVYSGKVIIPATIKVEDKTYSVTHIYDYAFSGSDISAIILPEGLLEIGYEAFRQCYKLKAVVIPASILNIDNNAFLFCFNLSSLTFKSPVRPIIGNYAFGRTKVNVKGISTGIPGNMAVPTETGERYKVDASRGVVVY